MQQVRFSQLRVPVWVFGSISPRKVLNCGVDIGFQYRLELFTSRVSLEVLNRSIHPGHGASSQTDALLGISAVVCTDLDGLVPCMLRTCYCHSSVIVRIGEKRSASFSFPDELVASIRDLQSTLRDTLPRM